MMCKRIYVIGTKPMHQANYVIGVQASNIYRSICKVPLENMDIRRSTFENVAEDVNAGLRGRGMDPSYDRIVIDTEAELHVCTSGLHTDARHREVSMEDFIMYPFRNHLGVILPYRLKGSHTYEMNGKTFEIDVYSANIIDPVEDFESFRRAIAI